MNGYEIRTEKKKDRIRYAAVELFSEHGIDNTSVSKIAKKAGVAPASVYNYFGTKDDLVKHTIIYFIEEQWKSLKKVLDSETAFPELLEQIIFTREEMLNTINLDFINDLINVSPDYEMKTYIEEFYQNRFPNAMHQFIIRGREEGYIHKELSDDAVLLYLEMYRDVAHRPDLLNNRNKDLLKELYSMMLYGLAGHPYNV